eukprot:6434054-Amphidinium_carterae.1
MMIYKDVDLNGKVLTKLATITSVGATIGAISMLMVPFYGMTKLRRVRQANLVSSSCCYQRLKNGIHCDRDLMSVLSKHS